MHWPGFKSREKLLAEVTESLTVIHILQSVSAELNHLDGSQATPEQLNKFVKAYAREIFDASGFRFYNRRHHLSYDKLCESKSYEQRLDKIMLELLNHPHRVDEWTRISFLIIDQDQPSIVQHTQARQVAVKISDEVTNLVKVFGGTFEDRIKLKYQQWTYLDYIPGILSTSVLAIGLGFKSSFCPCGGSLSLWLLHCIALSLFNAATLGIVMWRDYCGHGMTQYDKDWWFKWHAITLTMVSCVAVYAGWKLFLA